MIVCNLHVTISMAIICCLVHFPPRMIVKHCFLYEQIHSFLNGQIQRSRNDVLCLASSSWDVKLSICIGQHNWKFYIAGYLSKQSVTSPALLFSLGLINCHWSCLCWSSGEPYKNRVDKLKNFVSLRYRDDHLLPLESFFVGTVSVILIMHTLFVIEYHSVGASHGLPLIEGIWTI